MHEGHFKLAYRPMPAQSRFGLFSWAIHNENCYLPRELQFRQRILSARAASGLDEELLQTSSSWFNEDNHVAFINENENSWFLNNEFRPRQELSSDDFHIGLIDNQRLNWPGLSTLMRNIGDYLLIRNSHLSPEYFNQPMNYVLLDVVQILKRLATIDNPTYIAQQLKFLRHYLRAIEIHVPPTAGSDRLFLADCRYNLEVKVESEIIHNLITQQLEKRLYAVKSQLNKVGELRHIILHFSLAEEPVNPHPYWELFSNSEPSLDSNVQFPTLAAKSCANVNNAALPEFAIDPALLPVTLNENLLDTCPEFKFIENLPSEVKAAYGQGITDLQEIVRIQMILDKLLQTFDRAGEVFTMIQFREEIYNLLQGIEQFIKRSEKSILLVLDANTQAYHTYIQEKQDLTWWDKIVKSKQTQIDNFIINQDNLARFSTTPSDLHLASSELFVQINQVINNLNEQKSHNEQLKLISDVKNLIEQLMDSMHAWVNHQRITQGLPAMPKPANPSAKTIKQEISNQAVSEEPLIVKPSTNYNTLFRPKNVQLNVLPNNSPSVLLNSTFKPCPINNQPLLTGDSTQPFNSQSNNAYIWLTSFILLLPVYLLVIKIIYDKWQTGNNDLIVQGINKAEFISLMNQAADKLTVAAHMLNGSEWDEDIKLYTHTLHQLQTNLTPNRNELKELKELIKDIDYLIKSTARDLVTTNPPNITL